MLNIHGDTQIIKISEAPENETICGIGAFAFGVP
jgi:hypothetical protein